MVLFKSNINLKFCKWIPQLRDPTIVENKSRLLTNSSYLFILMSKLRLGVDNTTLFEILHLERFHKDPTRNLGMNDNEYIRSCLKSRSKFVGSAIDHALKLFLTNATTHFINAIRCDQNLNISFAIGNDIASIRQFPELLWTFCAVDSRTHKEVASYIEYIHNEESKLKKNPALYSHKINNSGSKSEIVVNYFGLILYHSYIPSGSAHDQRIHINYPKSLEYTSQFVLGDLGYYSNNNVNVITPIKDAGSIKDPLLKQKAMNYNRLHSRNRFVVENTFGREYQLFRYFNTEQYGNRQRKRDLSSFGYCLLNYSLIRNPIRTINSQPDILLLSSQELRKIKEMQSVVDISKKRRKPGVFLLELDTKLNEIIDVVPSFEDISKYESIKSLAETLGVNSIKQFSALMEKHKIPFCHTVDIKQQESMIQLNEDNKNIYDIDDVEEKENVKINTNNEDPFWNEMKTKYKYSYVNEVTTLFKINNHHVTSNVMSRLANTLKLDSDCIKTGIILEYYKRCAIGSGSIFDDFYVCEPDFIEYSQRLENTKDESFLNRTDIRKQRVIIIPKFMNLENSGHWYIYVFYPLRNNQTKTTVDDQISLVETNTVVICNSIRNCHDNYDRDINAVLKFWKEKFPDEHLGNLQRKDIKLKYANVPQQQGSIECGVFSLYFIHRLLDNKVATKSQYQSDDLFSFSEASQYRKQLLIELDEMYMSSCNVDDDTDIEMI